MTNRASIAVACLEPAERASVSDWLSQSGYDPVAVSDLSRLDEELHTNAVEALIAEVAMVPARGRRPQPGAATWEQSAVDDSR